MDLKMDSCLHLLSPISLNEEIATLRLAIPVTSGNPTQVIDMHLGASLHSSVSPRIFLPRLLALITWLNDRNTIAGQIDPQIQIQILIEYEYKYK